MADGRAAEVVAGWSVGLADLAGVPHGFSACGPVNKSGWFFTGQQFANSYPDFIEFKYFMTLNKNN
jgi:hypothetical protein